MTTQSFHHAIPEEILALSHERDMLRKGGQYARADALKRQIEEAGYAIKDNPHGAHLIILPSVAVDGEIYRTAHQMPSLLDTADCCLFSVNILAHNDFEETHRCLESVLHFATDKDIEIVLVDNASQDELVAWTENLQSTMPHLHVLHTSRTMGEAEARNLGLKRSRGRYILLLDSRVELTGDIFTPLANTLADTKIGITGLHGLFTNDLRHFEESQEIEVEVVSGLCMAFRRKLLKQIGFFDEHYRFSSPTQQRYVERNAVEPTYAPISHYMHADFSFSARDSDTRIVVTPDLPVKCHPETRNDGLSDAERARLTRRNFYRFLEKWSDRDDLLIEKE